MHMQQDYKKCTGINIYIYVLYQIRINNWAKKNPPHISRDFPTKLSKPKILQNAECLQYVHVI